MRVYEAKIQYNLLKLGEEPTLDSPGKIVEYMGGAFDDDPTVEFFYVLILNRKNRPIGRTMVTKGTATASLVHPREVLKPVILAGGTAAAVIHNHPSGSPDPSSADINVTRQLREAFKVMNIDLLDHLIIGDKDEDSNGIGYYSFAEAGLL